MSKSTQISFGQAMGMMAEAAPVMLLISMLGCFAFIGYTQFLFYSNEWANGMGERATLFGGLAAIMIQLCRLASGLSSSLHYKRGNIFSALTVFCFSVGLSFWEWHEIDSLASMIGGEPSLFLLQFCVVVSLALEFGLATTIEGGNIGKQEEQKYISQNDKYIFEKDKDFSSTGTAKSNGRSRSKKV